MSAFLLPNNHFNALASFAKDRLNGRTLYAGHQSNKAFRLNNKADFVKLCNCLRQANEESLISRYDDAFKEEITENPYTPKEVFTGYLREEDIISAVDCFHYQSCEFDDYYTSDAYLIAEAIKAIAVSALVDGKEKVWVIDDVNNPRR